jgi:subtilisin family serine protease
MRFVMSNRRAGKFRDSEKLASRAAVSGALSALAADIRVENDRQPDDELARRVVVFEANPGDVQNLLESLSQDVIIEPEILHWPSGRTPYRLLDYSSMPSTHLAVGDGTTLGLTVTGAGEDLAHAAVHLTLRGPSNIARRQTARSNAQGRVKFVYDGTFWHPLVAVVEPAGNFWATVAFGPTDSQVIDCSPLPKAGPAGWWHSALGIARWRSTAGRKIRVGVIDTGCGPHSHLSHVTAAGAFIDGAELSSSEAADVDSHGTHVAGIIAGRPDEQSGHYAGISPGVSLFAARVFPDANSGANQADIANAIDALSRDHRVDLLNLSLGARTGSQIELDAIQDALERGTLCICAAGNSNGPVEFPAGFKETVAISAIGKLGWGPPGSLSALRIPAGTADRFGDDGLYHANFSCFGDELDACGPGVGLIAPVPERFGLSAPYGVMDGTSMACPAVCAALATILAKSKEYLSLQRDETRSAMARSILNANLNSIGLGRTYEGGGMPSSG